MLCDLRKQRLRGARLVGAHGTLGEHEGRGESGGRQASARRGVGGAILCEHALGGARFHVAETGENRRILKEEALGLGGDGVEEVVGLCADLDHAGAVLIEQASGDAYTFGGVLLRLCHDVSEQRLRSGRVGDGRRGRLAGIGGCRDERGRHHAEDGREELRHERCRRRRGDCCGARWHAPKRSAADAPRATLRRSSNSSCYISTMHCATILTLRPRATIAAALLAAFAIALGGCSVARPAVRATEARVGTSASALTASIDITLELTNTSGNEVELVSYDYLIRLEDGASYDGRWAALRALPPGQTVKATVPAIVPVASARAGARWTVTGTMTYRDPQSFARILYEAGILKTESMFEGEGNLAAAAK